MIIQVNIRQAKRDISELVNRVTYQGEHIVLISHGRPKAVLISVEDFERLQKVDQRLTRLSIWLKQARALAEQIRRRRGMQDIDVNALLE